MHFVPWIVPALGTVHSEALDIAVGPVDGISLGTYDGASRTLS